MKAMVLERFREPLVQQTLPEPDIDAQEVLVRVRANGVCATDLKMVDGLVPAVRLPHVLGHEVAGEVVEVGQDVEGLRPGDHVTVYPTHGCGFCDVCRTGYENLCEGAPRTGFEVYGGFAEYMRTRGRNAVKIDDAVPFDEAAILPDAVAAPYHGVVRRGKVRVGETVVVIGVGGLGIHAVQIARIMGARVIAADVVSEKLRAAEEFGAEVVAADEEKGLAARVKELTNGLGADVVVECVSGDIVLDVLQQSAACLRIGGRLVVLGYAYGQPLSLDSADLIYGQWSILASRASTLQDVVDVARLVERGMLKPAVSERFPLEQANEALTCLRESSPLGRIVLTS
ncbi:MAG: alcohol dehydrogenase catalytic domain-containing protein [Chloroflexi bacterium]|nr:alcohol dehydrogenase catalytic domain-containing protein [Chloroflexota bacterium]